MVLGFTLSTPENAHADGLKLMKGSDCFTCHRVATKLVGPAYKDVAKKYKDQRPAIVKTLVAKIKNGGGGVWGPAAMSPHPQHSDAELTTMVNWILDLANAKSEDTAKKDDKGDAKKAEKQGYQEKSEDEIAKEAKENMQAPGCNLFLARGLNPYNPFFPVYLLLMGILAVFRIGRPK